MQQQQYPNFLEASQNGDEDVYVLPEDDADDSHELSEHAQIDYKNISRKQEMRDITENTEDEVIDEKLFV